MFLPVLLSDKVTFCGTDFNMRTQGLKFKIVLVISFALISCGKSDHQGVRQITVHELKARLDVTGPIGLYDVRTLEEIAIANIKGATADPKNFTEDNFVTVKEDKSSTILFKSAIFILLFKPNWTYQVVHFLKSSILPIDR